MTIFTQDQIEELVNIIKFQHILYGVSITDKSVLSVEDRNTLASFGINPDKIKIPNISPIEMSFQWGRLSSALGNYQSKRINYSDFKKFVQGGGHRELSLHETQTLKAIKEQSFQAVKNLGSRVAINVTNVITAEDIKNRANYEKILRKELSEGVVYRKSVAEITRELGLKTGDWNRDLGRLVETESHNAYETGRAAELREKHGSEVKVYKDVYPGACGYCIKAYLTGGIGSKPKIFTLSALEANGTNIGKKSHEYLPTLTSLHPHCRCTLHIYTEGTEWNNEFRSFTTPKDYKQKYAYNIEISIGSNNYNI